MTDPIPPEALRELAEDAEHLLHRLHYVQHMKDQDREERIPPLLLEFAGSPKSGKSTTIDTIQHFLRRMKFRVFAPSEGASRRTPYHLRRDLVAYNAWTLNYAVSEILGTYYNVEPPDIILIDRGVFDSLAWMGLLESEGQLTRDEAEVIRKFALHPKWASLISRLYLFTCTPEVSLQRDTESKLTTRGGIAMNPRILDLLLKQYNEFEVTLRDQYPVFKIDTTRPGTPQSTGFVIMRDILEVWSNHLSR